MLRKVASLTLTGNTKNRNGSNVALKKRPVSGGGRSNGSTPTTPSPGLTPSDDEGSGVISGSVLLEWFSKHEVEGVKELGVKCCELLCSIGVLVREGGGGKKGGFDAGGVYRWSSVNVRGSPEREVFLEGKGDEKVVVREEDDDSAAAAKAGE